MTFCANFSLEILSIVRAESGEDIDLNMPNPKKQKLSPTPREIYKSYLKSKYLEKKMPDYGKWPKSTSKKFINLATIQKNCNLSEEEKSKALIHGDVRKINSEGSIQFEDLAIPSKDCVLSKFVLVEGAPGVGKSTFAWEACRKWANGEILQDYELVILIRLRDESVRKAKCLEDLIQYPRDPKIREMVIDEVIKTGGKGVFLLLEGYDELPSFLQEKGSLFRQVINGYQFCEGTVLVTSRHWASEPFLLPNYTTERPVSQHIEILGFNRENIDEYLSDMLTDEPSLFADLQQYLEAYPHIHSMMYIPLNCAIVLEVYRKSKRQSLPFPTTMTELYSSLILCLLLRHIGDLPEYKDKRIKLNKISELPQPLNVHFNILTKLAYEGICNNNQQIIFTEEDILAEHDISLANDNQTLGLMQTATELYFDTGAKKTFNFLHLTIQEFLAAYHILSFTTDVQIKWLRDNTSDKHFEHSNQGTVLKFLAGLSPKAYETVLADVTPPNAYETVLSPPLLKLARETICMLFEAKVRLSDRHVAVKNVHIPHTYTMYMLGSIIANSSHTCHWDVHIFDIADTIQMFERGIGIKKVESNLTLRLSVANDFQRLSKLSGAIQHLHLIEGSNNYDIKPFSEKSDTHIKHLQLTSFHFYSTESQSIESFIKSTPRFTYLTLDCCFFNIETTSDILPGVEACSNIEKLCIYTFDHDECRRKRGLENVHQILGESKSLNEFEISSEINVLSELSGKSLCTNTSIEKLSMSCNNYEWFQCRCITEGEICECDDEWEIYISQWQPYTTKFAKMIKENKTLTELTINMPDSACIIAEAMCENNTLQKLTICDDTNYRESAVEVFASMLRENTTLKEFSLLSHRTSDEETIRVLNILTDSLSQNITLSKMQITFDCRLSSSECLEAISAKCDKDDRLIIMSTYPWYL